MRELDDNIAKKICSNEMRPEEHTVISSGLQVWKDLMFAIGFVCTDHLFFFHVYEVLDFDGNDNPIWQKDDSPSHPDYELKLENAQIYYEGKVKWDHCSDVSFHQSWMHFCSHGRLNDVGQMMLRVFNMASEHITHWPS